MSSEVGIKVDVDDDDEHDDDAIFFFSDCNELRMALIPQHAHPASTRQDGNILAVLLTQTTSTLGMQDEVQCDGDALYMMLYSMT